MAPPLNLSADHPQSQEFFATGGEGSIPKTRFASPVSVLEKFAATTIKREDERTSFRLLERGKVAVVLSKASTLATQRLCASRTGSGWSNPVSAHTMLKCPNCPTCSSSVARSNASVCWTCPSHEPLGLTNTLQDPHLHVASDSPRSRRPIRSDLESQHLRCWNSIDTSVRSPVMDLVGISWLSSFFSNSPTQDACPSE